MLVLNPGTALVAPDLAELGPLSAPSHVLPPALLLHRYKEHEDGYMRLQLVRYESVELTQQLLRQPQEAAGLGAALSESGLQGILLEPVPGEPGPPEEAEEEEGGRGGESTVLPASQDTPSPVVHVVNQTNAHGEQEIVYYVLSEAPGEHPAVPGSPSDSVVGKLQGMPEEPGAHLG